LKDFANSNVGTNPGNMSVFNDAWNEIEPDAAAAQVGGIVDYLLRSRSNVALEDRVALPLVERVFREAQHPAGHRDGDTVNGQFTDQREQHFGLTSRDR
jgi:hypothetical protein